MTVTTALHPQRTSDPQVVSWVTSLLASACLGKGDRVVLQELREQGSVVDVGVRPGRVEVRADREQAWRRLGPLVRSQLASDIADAVGRHGDDDEALLEVARTVLETRVAGMARSHGGLLEVVAAHEGIVTVSRSGACGHCPAAALTVNVKFEAALRAEVPTLRAVRSVGAGFPSLHPH